MSYKPFPKPIPFTKLLGPSFILLALGLGSGEIILWPFLASNWGLGIIWGALLGITFQFFINMEITRYALVKGESVFVGFGRLLKWAPYWFIVSTFIGFGLPGIIAASAQIFGSVLNITNFRLIAIGLLLVIGLILSLGKTVYGVLERLTKTIIFLGIPFIVILTITLASGADWVALFQGLVGQGDGYNFLPPGIMLVTFFAAFAYSGAGGNLNLTQSIYVKEKGYGMGAYSQKIAGLFTEKNQHQKINLEGHDFELTPENLSNFKIWWKKVNLEHLLVFWFLGFLGIVMLMLLAFITTFGLDSNAQGITFVLSEGAIIGQLLSPFIGGLFLIVLGIMLFQTQLGILDSTSRIMAENFAIKHLEALNNSNKKISLSKIYFSFLWAQITFGIVLLSIGISEPKSLIILGAIINALAMFVHIGMTTWLNHKTLPRQLKPALWRRAVLLLIFMVFGFFSIFIIVDTVRRFLT